MATVSIPVTPTEPAQTTDPNPQTMLSDIAEQVRMLRAEIRTIAGVMTVTRRTPVRPVAQEPADVSPQATPQESAGPAPRLRGEAWELSVKRSFVRSRLL